MNFIEILKIASSILAILAIISSIFLLINKVGYNLFVKFIERITEILRL